MARNLTDPVDGCLRRARYLMHDRDPALHEGFWRDPRGRACPADPSPAEESQSQRVCRAVRPLNQRGVSQSRRPPRRRARASPRGRVRRPRPSRAKPPGTRQPAPATTATAGEPGRRRSAAGASGRIAQFLPPGGRMSGRPIKRTLRRRGDRTCLHGGGWRTITLASAADVLVRWWPELRRCKHAPCGVWFLPTHGRQWYHDARCASAARYQRFKPTRDYKAEYARRHDSTRPPARHHPSGRMKRR